MTKLMIAVFTGLFVMSLGSLSLAGMLDKLTGKADEATQEVSETVKSEKAEAGEAIEAQDASTTESGSMIDDAKETVKESVDETIDGIGK